MFRTASRNLTRRRIWRQLLPRKRYRQSAREPERYSVDRFRFARQVFGGSREQILMTAAKERRQAQKFRERSQSADVINVDVTKEDILHGERGHSERCAVARALKRATKAGFVQVKNRSMNWRKKNGSKATVWDVPQEIWRRVHWLDTGQGCEPFSFKIRLK
jgi:hypothetical protein